MEINGNLCTSAESWAAMRGNTRAELPPPRDAGRAKGPIHQIWCAHAGPCRPMRSRKIARGPPRWRDIPRSVHRGRGRGPCGPRCPMTVRGRPVSRILCEGRAPAVTIHLGPASPRASGSQPGSAGGEAAPGPVGPRDPYSALLPAGLAVPVRSPVPRWALTPPFHPCPGRAGAVSSLWRCPSACTGRALPGAVAPWSPDFPPRRGARAPRRSGHPAIRAPWTYESPGAGSRQGWAAASPAIRPASASESGPSAPGRKRRRNAARTAASGPR